MVLFGVLILLAPTVFVSLYLRKKEKWMLYCALVANVVLILSMFGMVSNNNDEVYAQYKQTTALETTIDNYFTCVGVSESFDDLISCATTLRASYDYHMSNK